MMVKGEHASFNDKLESDVLLLSLAAAPSG